MATHGSRELRREQTNEALEILMEQAVAAVQEMDQAEYQAKVCEQRVPPGEGAVDVLPGGSLMPTHTHPCSTFLWGLTWPTWRRFESKAG